MKPTPHASRSRTSGRGPANMLDVSPSLSGKMDSAVVVVVGLPPMVEIRVNDGEEPMMLVEVRKAETPAMKTKMAATTATDTMAEVR